MKIKILMMQKNESILFPVWTAFHSAIFGAQNLYILDNGSTNNDNLAQLNSAELAGATIIRKFSKKSDFEEKGQIIAKIIQELDDRDPADFYFPLDCDEFIGAMNNNKPQFNFNSIEKALSRHKNTKGVLSIGFGYDNLPKSSTRFAFRQDRKKTFFPRDTCLTLDNGFHGGISKWDTPSTSTDIGYIHLHNRPFAELVSSAKEKLQGRVQNFEASTLREHKESKKNGTHLVDEMMLASDKDYQTHIEKKYQNRTIVDLPEFREALIASNTDYPWS